MSSEERLIDPHDVVETAEPVHSVPREDLNEVHEHANALIGALEKVEDGDLITEIVATALKLLRDQTSRADVKLINTSLKELRYALKIFTPYRDVKKISIFGSARTPEEHADYKAALEFGRRMAEQNWMVITGAGGGIMAAGHGGAGPKPSFGLAIRLPFEQKTNDFIANDPKLINFKYFFTRKLMFVRSSHAIALFPGGFGTMDEGFEALTLLQTGKSAPMPIVYVDSEGSGFWNAWQDYVNNHLLTSKLISPEDLNLYKITQDMDEAVREVTHYYHNFHSIRYVHDTLLMRIHRRPSTQQMAEIKRKFSSIKVKDDFEIVDALPIEKDEPSIVDMPRLAFKFNRKNHGELRLLINYLNEI